MSKPKISVIIPVYNVEKYLGDCLDSIVNQTLKEIEVIIVNDSSPDNSLAIAEEFAMNDNRVKFITKPNGGVASARNEGLKYVTGEYIVFIDSDDWIEPKMFEKMYNAANLNTAEIVICNVKLYFENSKIFKDFCTHKKIIEKNNNSLVFTDSEKKKHLLNLTVCWNKLFKADFYLNNNFKYPDGFIYEEPPVLFPSIAKANKVVIVPEPLYIYRIRPGSNLSRKDRTRFDVFNTYKLVSEFLNSDENKYAEYLDIYVNKMVLGFFNHFMLIHADYKKEFFNKACDVINSLNKEEIKLLNPYLYFKYLLFKTRMYRLSLFLTPLIIQLDKMYFKFNAQ